MVDAEFFERVSFNCDVSDAKFWGNFSICTLLLRLRELFKIERALEPWDTVENSEILEWIEKKEKTWHSLENAEFVSLKLNSSLYSPFDITQINEKILKHNLVYGAGYALYMKPSFFVGSIERIKRINGYTVYFVGREIARDLFSSPGMSLNKNIYIRLTDIKYRLWEDLQSWNAEKKRLSKFIFSNSWANKSLADVSQDFNRIVEKFAEIVMYHEIAEQSEKFTDWNSLLSECNSSKTEQIIRAITDLVADFSAQGPLSRAISERDSFMLALYIQTLGPYQKKILKTLINNFEEALLLDNWNRIEKLREQELEKWKSQLEKIMKIYTTKGFQQVKTFTDKIFEGGIN